MMNHHMYFPTIMTLEVLHPKIIHTCNSLNKFTSNCKTKRLRTKLLLTKLGPGRVSNPGYFAKKKTFSRRPRKPLNACPIITQRHCSPCEMTNDRSRALDPCFGVVTYKVIFLTQAQKFIPTRNQTQDPRRYSRGS